MAPRQSASSSDNAVKRPQEGLVSPYLNLPLRSLEDVLRQRRIGRAYRTQVDAAPSADNCNLSQVIVPPAKSA